MVNYIFKDKKCKEFYAVASYLLTSYDTKFTYTNLYRSLLTHTEYPSLLTLIDVLSEYGIRGKAIHKGSFNYSDFEAPFVCSIQEKRWDYPAPSVVVDAGNEHITYLNPKNNQLVTVNQTDFEQIDQNVVVLLDGSMKKRETNYDVSRKAEIIERVMIKLAWIVVVLSVVVPSTFSLTNGPNVNSWIYLSFLSFSFVGTMLCVVALLREVDVDNPILDDFCGSKGKKVNCDAILSSSGSSFLGLKLSIWAFSYFFAFFVIQSLFATQERFINLWAASSLLTSPIIVYSLYYQAKIAKQWCPLCLGILAALFGLVGSSIIFFTSGNGFFSDWYSISISAIVYVATFLLTFYIMPLIKYLKEGEESKREWKRFKYNSEIFESILSKGTPIVPIADSLGIIIGNTGAKQEIIKVCNPYCKPCAKAHFDLEQIIAENLNVRVRIIFTASGESEDPKNAPVSHLLAIQEHLGSDRMIEALNSWYSPDVIDYQKFAEKYPLNVKLTEQKEKIKAMRRWCNEMRVQVTPTLYVNGYKLPEEYHIKELKYFF